MDICNYILKYRKETKKFITTDKILTYLHNRFDTSDTYNIGLLNISKNYAFNFDKYIYNSDIIILILKTQGVILYGAKSNMNNINLVKTYCDKQFKERTQYLMLLDSNNIIVQSCQFITTDLCCEQIFYKTEILFNVLNLPN